LIDPTSPQSLVLTFMVDPLRTIRLHGCNAYVASVLYFALDGVNWTLSLNVLNHTLATCSWFVSLGITQAFGVFCDASSTRIQVIQIGKSHLDASLVVCCYCHMHGLRLNNDFLTSTSNTML
jgi:hypothetical protein